MNIYESPISMSRHRHPNSGFCYIFSRPLIGTLFSRGRRCKRGSCTSRPPRSQNGSWSSPRWCPQKKNKKMAIRNSWNPLFQHHCNIMPSCNAGLWHGMTSSHPEGTSPLGNAGCLWFHNFGDAPSACEDLFDWLIAVLAMARMATGGTAILAILMRFIAFLLGRNISAPWSDDPNISKCLGTTHPGLKFRIGHD